MRTSDVYCSFDALAPGASISILRPPAGRISTFSNIGVLSRYVPEPGWASKTPVMPKTSHDEMVPRSSLPGMPYGVSAKSVRAARRTADVFHGAPVQLYIQGACRSGSLFGLKAKLLW